MTSIRHANLDGYLAIETAVERQVARLLRGKSNPVIFDIGACEGEDSVRYARLFPGARIFAFEPLPSNQELAQRNFEKYAVRNAELIPLALSNQTGMAEFHVSAGQPATGAMGEDWNYGNKSSSLLAPATVDPMHGWLSFPETAQVKTQTLDEFCAARGISHIDFVHMDVQGAESLVLEGAQRMLPRVTAIWLEVANEELYAGQKLRPHIEEWLRARNFASTVYESWGPEGNQLYVNLRSARGLLFALAFRVRGALRERLPQAT